MKKETKTCYIVGAGPDGEPDFTPAPGDFVIAADGGQEKLKILGIAPDLVVGDFDSSKRPSAGKVVELPERKDHTDTGIAARIALERGYKRIYIFGGTGGRPDHTFANIQTAAWLAQNGVRAFLAGSWACSAVTDGALIFPAGMDGGVSVFSLTDRAEGVYLTGLDYPLEDAVLENMFPLGVSNRFTGAAATVSVRRGTLAVMWENTGKNRESFYSIF